MTVNAECAGCGRWRWWLYTGWYGDLTGRHVVVYEDRGAVVEPCAEGHMVSLCSRRCCEVFRWCWPEGTVEVSWTRQTRPAERRAA